VSFNQINPRDASSSRAIVSPGARANRNVARDALYT
jgi:hypothetical protein